MDVRTVAVFGSSGRQGQAQVRRLLADGYTVRALTRNAEIFSGAEFAGVQVQPADYGDPASLDSALDGVDAAFFQPPMDLPPELSLEYTQNLAAASERANLKQFVLNTTMWIPDEPCDQPLYDLMLMVKNILAGADIPLTVLCPTIFMDNWLARFAKPALVKEHVYRYPHRTDFFMTPISLDDMAKFMVAVLGRDDMIGAQLRVAGPETLNPPKIAEALSAAMGVEVVHEYITPRQFGEYLYSFMGIGEAGIDEDTYAGFIEHFYNFNMDAPQRPFYFDVAPTLEKLAASGLAASDMDTFEDWAKRQDWTTLDDAVGSTTG